MAKLKIWFLNLRANRKLRKCDVDGFNAIIDKLRAELKRLENG